MARAAVPGRVHRRDREGASSTSAGCPPTPKYEHRRGGEGDRRAPARCRCSCPTRTTRASAPTSCSSRPTGRSSPSARSSSGGTDDRARRPRPARRRRLRGLPRPQGPRPAVPRPVPGADLRRRVPARPVLRHDRPRRDRRGPRDRRAVDEGAHRPRRRGGAVQVTRAREGQGQDHRPAARAARRQGRRLQGRAAEPPAQRHPHLRRARERARPDAHRRLLRRGHARVHRRARAASRAGSRSGSSRCGRSRCRPATRSTRSSQGRAQFTLDQWRDLLLRSVGFEPARFTRRAAGRPARSDGPVRRAELQRRRARPTRHRQVAPVPAGLAVRPPRLGRQGDDRQHVREQRDRPARARRAVRRHLLRRGVGRLVRHEGRRQHPQGLHGVRRVQPRQGEHPRRRRHRHGRQLRRRRAGGAAPRPPLRADAQGDARRHGVPRPHPRVPARLGRAEARSVVLHRATSGSSATSSPSAGASCAARRGSTSPRAASSGEASSAAAIARPPTTRSTAC